jgi:hypothetical protein
MRVGGGQRNDTVMGVVDRSIISFLASIISDPFLRCKVITVHACPSSGR